MKAQYRTFSFWFCVGMAVVNFFLFFISKHLGSLELMKLNLVTMIACAVGAGSHWYLEKLLAKKKS